MSLQGTLGPEWFVLAQWVGQGVPCQRLQPRDHLQGVQPEWVGERQGVRHWKWGLQGVLQVGLLGWGRLQWGRVGWLQNSWAALAGQGGVWPALEQRPQQQMRLQTHC